MKADLHLHSLHSNDGERSVPEIIELCIKNGVDTFSVTDHNCIGGSREAIRQLDGQAAIRFIPGIEIDCNFRGTDIHLLGYQVDIESGDFIALESDVRQKHMDAIPRMIRNLEGLGIHLDLDELMQKSGDRPPSAELFAELLLEKPGQGSNPRLKPYFPGGERSDMPLINFYLDYFAQGKPAYVYIDHMDFEQALDLVKGNGGIPVVAHPGLNLSGREELAGELLDHGAAGLEVFNNYHSGKQVAFFAELASQRGALMTCGSDYHGKNKPLISIGQYTEPAGYHAYLEQSIQKIIEN